MIKKIQLTNIILLGLGIIINTLFIVSALTNSSGFQTKLSYSLILSLINFLLPIIYLIFAIMFYRSNKKENGLLKSALWISIISIILLWVFLLIIVPLLLIFESINL